MHYERPYAADRGPALALLGVAGFSSVVSTRLCDAMLPALAQAFTTSTREAAATISAYAIGYSVMLLVYGPLGDRFGKLRVIGLAAGSCAASTACATLAPSLQTLVLARAAMGAGTAAIVPLTIAWIGDTVPLAQRQQTLARYAGFTVIGMVVGPVLGGLFAQTLGWRGAFAVLVPVFAVLAFTMLRAHAHTPDAPAAPPQPYLQQVLGLLRTPRTRLVMAAACVETALGIATLAFLPTVLYEHFGLPPLHGGGVAAMFGVGGFAFSRSARRLLQRIGPMHMPGLGGAALFIAFGMLALMPHWGWATIACTLAGFGFFAIHNTLQVLATELSPTATGLAVSLFASCIFIGQSVGVAVGAITFTRFSPAWSFSAAAVGLLLLGTGLSAVLRREQRRQPAATASIGAGSIGS
jgi:predicted MFS family arabinose efflux permease